LRAAASDPYFSTAAANFRSLSSGVSQGLADAISKIDDKILDMAENTAIEAVFGKTGTAGASSGGLLGGTLTNWFSGLFGTAAVHHAGGIVGEPGPTRLVPLSIFDHAPRFHSGTGFGPGEVPAVLQVGEAVLDRRDTASIRQMVAASRASSGSTGASSGSRSAASSGQPIVNNFQISTPDVASFRQSQGQIAGMVTRAAQRGARNM
jgi:hypothetical protein